MEAVENKTFRGVTVHMDGKTFLKCVFTDCRLIYSGGDFAWRETTFTDCQISFEGSAKRTVEYLGYFKMLNPQKTQKPSAETLP